MHTKERVQRVMGFIWRRKRAAIALLLVGPLVTGSGHEVFALNAVGLGIGAMIVRGQVLRRREARMHRMWLQRRAEREEDEHQRWLKRRERDADQTAV